VRAGKRHILWSGSGRFFAVFFSVVTLFAPINITTILDESQELAVLFSWLDHISRIDRAGKVLPLDIADIHSRVYLAALDRRGWCPDIDY